jgi:hypothetical protein
MRALGVHVTSNSWSFDDTGAESRWLYDSIAFNFSDIFYVFAAGNDQRYDAINSPAYCKNGLAIGALRQPSGANAAHRQSDVRIVSDGFAHPAVVPAGVIWALGLERKMRYLVDKEVVSPGSNVSDKIVLFNASAVDCAILPELRELGALAVIGEGADRFARSPLIAVGTQPSLLRTGQHLSLFPLSGDEGMPVTVASLSSKGPAKNALQKPDIAVPGEEIRSSRAGITCETIDAVIVSSGTSTATPRASAAAAIVCQFLEDR